MTSVPLSLPPCALIHLYPSQGFRNIGFDTGGGKNQRTASSPPPLLQGFSDRCVTFSGFRTGSPCAGDPHPDRASFLPPWASWHLGGQGSFPPSHLQVQPGGSIGWTLGFCDDACCPSPGLMGISCLLSNSKAGFPTYKNSFSHPNPGCCKTL